MEATTQPKHYELDLTQGDLQIQLVSDDMTFISEQINRWFEALLNENEYPAAVIPKSPVESFATAPVATLQPEATAPQPAPTEAVPPNLPGFEQPVQNPAKTVENSALEFTSNSIESPSPVGFSPSSAVSQQPVENLLPVEQIKDVAQISATAIQKSESNDLDAIMDTLMADLGEVTSPKVQMISTPPRLEIPQTSVMMESAPPPTAETLSIRTPETETAVPFGVTPQAAAETAPSLAPAEPPAEIEAAIDEELKGIFEEDVTTTTGFVDIATTEPIVVDESAQQNFQTAFEEVLAKDPQPEIPQPIPVSNAAPSGPVTYTYDPSKEGELAQIESLAELCDLSPNATKGEDFLLLAAFFLAKVKTMEKYTLKDLNAQLVRTGLTPVNHGILENVISQGLVQLVPDLTGNAVAAEYTITDNGLGYGQHLMG